MEYILSRPRLMFALGFIVLGLIAFSFIPMSWFKKTTYESNTQADALTLINKKLSGDYLMADSGVNNLPNWKKAMLESANGTSTFATSEISIDEQKKLDDPNNVTAQFAKNAYVISSYLNQQGLNDPNAINKVSDNTINAELSKLAPKIYSKSDLKITSKSDFTTLNKYVNDLFKYIFGTLETTSKIDNSKILSDYFKNKNSKELEKYNPEIKSLTTLRDNLKNMSVPSTAVDNHLAELNSVEASLNTVNNLSKVDTDPIRASVAYNNIEQININIILALKNFKTFFNKQGIVFDAKELNLFFN